MDGAGLGVTACAAAAGLLLYRIARRYGRGNGTGMGTGMGEEAREGRRRRKEEGGRARPWRDAARGGKAPRGARARPALGVGAMGPLWGAPAGPGPGPQRGCVRGCVPGWLQDFWQIPGNGFLCAG